MKSNIMLGVAICALSLAHVSQTRAQTQNPDQSVKLETVIVTATKKKESLQDVPLSIVALNGAKMAQAGIREFTGLAAMVPDLEINQTNGNHVLTVRGLGSGAGNLAFEQSVGLFVDGVFSSRARALEVPLFDIERVEVVRGPQGALFGVNTDAGAISVITNKPTDDFEAQLRAGYEAAQGGYITSGFVSGPISNDLDGRIAAEYGANGAFIRNRLTHNNDNGEHYAAVRAQLLWKPTESFSALLKVEGLKDDFSGSSIEYNSMGDLAICGLCAVNYAAAGGASAQVWPAFWRTARPRYPEYDRTKSGNVTLTVNWNLSGWQLRWITAYQGVTADQHNNLNGGALTLLYAFQTEHSNQFSTELRVEHQFENGFNIASGITYLRNKLNVEQDVLFSNATFPPFPLNGDSILPLYQDGHTISPYLIADYPVTKHIDLNASVRYSSESKSADIVHRAVGRLPPTYLPYNLHGRFWEGLWDYSAKARYIFNPDASVYVSYATGTKAGGFVSNNSTLYFDILNHGATVDFKSELAKSWEIGGKFLFLDGAANLNIALFDTNFDNLQVSTYVNGTFLTGNAAKAHSRGIEVDGNWRVDRHVTIGANGAYLDAKYDDYPGGACRYDAPPTCTPATNNLKGAPLLRAPTWKGSAYIEAQTTIYDSLRLAGRLSADYTSRSYFQPDLHPLNSMPAYAKLNGRLSLSAPDDRWEIAVIGRNLTNKVTWSQGITTPIIGDNSHDVVVNPPRTVMIEATIRN